ncbi:Type III secretion system protein BsaK [Paraburkholderia ribeironis]|uniref:Type III secretion system protein BsaK n=1 Tax=Paraburkholderia ribeironis TaxID=1247936 RepID=A0A1N7SDE6_9BURK|nr:type III secretion system inner rod subunit SctI [Paraburkholderia ribeironis]SIT44999.1 Type III secretion system protein BsaK [Paraburkholderia ribeironis]
MDITDIQAASRMRTLGEIEADGEPQTLGDLLRSALVEANRKASADSAQIDARIADFGTFGDPKQLFALQTDLANYNIYVSLVSTLTRKAVSAVETLVKAQS